MPPVATKNVKPISSASFIKSPTLQPPQRLQLFGSRVILCGQVDSCRQCGLSTSNFCAGTFMPLFMKIKLLTTIKEPSICRRLTPKIFPILTATGNNNFISAKLYLCKSFSVGKPLTAKTILHTAPNENVDIKIKNAPTIAGRYSKIFSSPR